MGGPDRQEEEERERSKRWFMDMIRKDMQVFMKDDP